MRSCMEQHGCVSCTIGAEDRWKGSGCFDVGAIAFYILFSKSTTNSKGTLWHIGSTPCVFAGMHSPLIEDGQEELFMEKGQ